MSGAASVYVVVADHPGRRVYLSLHKGRWRWIGGPDGAFQFGAEAHAQSFADVHDSAGGAVSVVRLRFPGGQRWGAR